MSMTVPEVASILKAFTGLGSCAKTVVTCTLVAADGEEFIGENLCGIPQKVCPRRPGEDYKKCSTICNQVGHAEVVALALAGDKAAGAHAFIRGHTYACMDCQHALYGAGVQSISVLPSE